MSDFVHYNGGRMFLADAFAHACGRIRDLEAQVAYLMRMDGERLQQGKTLEQINSPPFPGAQF